MLQEEVLDIAAEMHPLVHHPDHEEHPNDIDEIQTKISSVPMEGMSEKLHLDPQQQNIKCSNASNTEFGLPVSSERNLENYLGEREQKPVGDELIKCSDYGCDAFEKRTFLKHIKSSQCDFCTAFKNTLELHIRKINLNGKSFFMCSKCQYYTALEDYMYSHIKGVHFKQKSFKCSECEYSASKKENLSRHIKAVHLKEKPFKCSKCKFCSFYKQKLTLHIKAVH